MRARSCSREGRGDLLNVRWFDLSWNMGERDRDGSLGWLGEGTDSIALGVSADEVEAIALSVI